MDLASLKHHFVFGPRKADPRWRDGLSADELQALWLVKLEDERVAALKTHAGNVILARFPDWKQRNMIAHSLKLDRIARTRTLDIDEQSAYDSYEAAWAWVEKIRLESDRLEKIPDATIADGNWNP